MILDVRAFKTLLRQGRKMPDGAIVQKRPSAYGPAEMFGERTARFTVSDGGIDRDRDTVAVDGWQLDEFRANPIALWQHGMEFIGGAPVARVIDIGPDNGALKATFEFQPPDMPIVGDWAEMIHRSLKTGFLRATSVGFIPDEWEVAEDRMREGEWFPPVDFKRQRLCEISIVSVPSNPRALLEQVVEPQAVPFGNPPPVVENAAPDPATKTIEELAATYLGASNSAALATLGCALGPAAADHVGAAFADAIREVASVPIVATRDRRALRRRILEALAQC